MVIVPKERVVENRLVAETIKEEMATVTRAKSEKKTAEAAGFKSTKKPLVQKKP
jgi:hypothetical protein